MELDQPNYHYDNNNHERVTNHTHINDQYSYLSSFPPGYRFEPLDQELIIKYLQPKINGQRLPINLMHEVNIYKHNPEDLADNFLAQGEKIWYFFTPREKKYRNGRRPNRKAGNGFWKATGADKVIKHDGKEVGFRKALVFYKGKPPKGDKTPWIMHEFRVSGPPLATKRTLFMVYDNDEDTSMRLDDFVLCRIHKKEEGSSRNQPRLQQGEVRNDYEQQEEGDDDDDDGIVGQIPLEETEASSVDSVLPSNNTWLPEITSYNNNNKMICSTPSVTNYYAADVCQANVPNCYAPDVFYQANVPTCSALVTNLENGGTGNNNNNNNMLHDHLTTTHGHGYRSGYADHDHQTIMSSSFKQNCPSSFSNFNYGSGYLNDMISGLGSTKNMTATHDLKMEYYPIPMMPIEDDHKSFPSTSGVHSSFAPGCHDSSINTNL